MIVNIVHPTFWTRQDYWDYQNQTPGMSGKWNDFQYRINDLSKRDSDFFVVHENIDEPMRVRARSGCFCLVTGEEKLIVENYHQDYLNQFDIIITSRDDIQHSNVIKGHYLHPWWIKKTYDELDAMECPKKPRVLSAVISNLTGSASHKNRFAFINKLKGHYKDNLDWFSKGESTYLPNKWDGLAPYEYSIVIENSYYPNYFTEKISDCFLAYTMPFYQGCSNIKDFFDERSFVQIDTRDFVKSIKIIDESIQAKLAKENFKYIQESRHLVLTKYHFLAALTNILEKVKKSEVRVNKTIKPHRYFNESKLKRLIKASAKIVNRLP